MNMNAPGQQTINQYYPMYTCCIVLYVHFVCNFSATEENFRCGHRVWILILGDSYGEANILSGVTLHGWLIFNEMIVLMH